MSRQSEAKSARRKKRRAARDANWIPEALLDELASSDVVNDAAELELLDSRITERGWTFDDELSDDAIAIWFYGPSGAEDGDDEVVTTIWMSDADDGEFVHLLLVGISESYQFAPDEFFEHLDVIESYRFRRSAARAQLTQVVGGTQVARRRARRYSWASPAAAREVATWDS